MMVPDLNRNIAYFLASLIVSNREQDPKKYGPMALIYVKALKGTQ